MPLLRLEEEEAGVLPGAVGQVASCEGGTEAVLGEGERRWEGGLGWVDEGITFSCVGIRYKTNGLDRDDLFAVGGAAVRRNILSVEAKRA